MQPLSSEEDRRERRCRRCEEAVVMVSLVFIFGVVICAKIFLAHHTQTTRVLAIGKRKVLGLWEGLLDWQEKTSEHKTSFELNLWYSVALESLGSTNRMDWKMHCCDTIGENPNEVTKSVDTIILHPNYDSVTSDNDIALIRLSTPVQFTDYIRPVCLAAGDSTFNNGTDSWVTGWGAVQEGVSLPFPESLQCNCLNGVGTVPDNMICAGVLAG